MRAHQWRGLQWIFAGPQPLTADGNRYICVAMDYFTKWPEAYAIPNQEATTVARVLVDQFFCRFGIPHELHSDQGRNFESAVFSECCKLLGIKKTRTTPPRPQSDVMVEKFNWTLGQELAKSCIEEQTEWDQKLPVLLMAYRSAAHESGGYTPAKLMLGHELRLPVGLLTGRPPDAELPEETTSYVKGLQEGLTEVRHQIRGALEFSGEVMKLNHDVKASQVCYKDSDKVWLYNPLRKKGQSPKL
ncbi:protein NYNRIN-like [Homarus americanus]|uniref:protein NYNRIN-like n=1 Tax=Homarus americanus TaxID=6706 RepID=UPI001C4608EF|nr:protein NYNRIN-like [Homarus americanus]